MLEEAFVRNLVRSLRAHPTVTVELYTNGFLLSAKFLDFCREMLVSLAVGLYGADASESRGLDRSIPGLNGASPPEGRFLTLLRDLMLPDELRSRKGNFAIVFS